MASYPDTTPNNRFQTTASCYCSSLLSLLSPRSLIPSTLLADIQIDRPLVFGNLASRQFRALHTVSHSFRSPYRSHSAPLITSHSAPHDHTCPVPCFCDCHRHCTHIRNSFSAFPFDFPAVPYSFRCIDCCIPYRFKKIRFDFRFQSKHTRIIQGFVMDNLLRSLVQLHVTGILYPNTPHALYTFFCHCHRHCTHTRTLILFLVFLSFFSLLILGLSYPSLLCIDCCPSYRF